MDGTAMGSYTHNPDPESNIILYNVPVFSLNGLQNVSHTLVVSLAYAHSLMLFDYAVYTSVRLLGRMFVS
jgi:hypothetical protein